MKEIFSNSLKGHELRLQIVKYLHEPNFRRPFSTTQPPQPVFPHNKENNAGVMVAGEERSKFLYLSLFLPNSLALFPSFSLSFLLSLLHTFISQPHFHYNEEKVDFVRKSTQALRYVE
jgi:hypothetical protein